MNNQFDITNHKWSHPSIKGCEIFPDDFWLSGSENPLAIGLCKNDVISISKHFYNQLSTHERLEYINAIRGADCKAPKKDSELTTDEWIKKNFPEQANLGVRL